MPKDKILVAEDETDLREMCVRVLELAGYEAVGVADGQQAVERAREDSFDLFLTDVKMPQMNGLEAYRLIRSLRPSITAVVMTGFGTMQTAIEALQLGVSEFILKPFRPDELASIVSRALARARLERENARLQALVPLFDLSRVFMSSVDLKTLTQKIVHTARQEMHADSASLMLLNERQELVIQAAEGLADEVPEGARQPLDQGIAGYVVTHREPLVLQGNVRDDPRFRLFYEATHITSAISLPLIYQEKVLGVLNVTKMRESPPFDEGDLEFLSILGSQAAVAIANAHLFGEIQAAYQRLAELDYLKSEFISIAAHELRSPLAVVLSYATLLEEEAEGPMREHLQHIVQAATQLKRIVDQMVSLRQIDTGNIPVQVASVDVAQVVGTVVEDLRLLAERKQQQVRVTVPSDLPSLQTDRQLLRIILNNLLSNAIKFTPEGGTIRLSAELAEQQLLLSVADTGVGIPAEELERIFERFYQVEDSLRRTHEGIGLGLSVAREMAELLGGRIWAESQVGRGSTFFLALPLSAHP